MFQTMDKWTLRMPSRVVVTAGIVAEGAGYSGDLRRPESGHHSRQCPDVRHIKIPDKCNKLANMGNSKQDCELRQHREGDQKFVTHPLRVSKNRYMRNIHQIP